MPRARCLRSQGRGEAGVVDVLSVGRQLEPHGAWVCQRSIMPSAATGRCDMRKPGGTVNAERRQRAYSETKQNGTHQELRDPRRHVCSPIEVAKLRDDKIPMGIREAGPRAVVAPPTGSQPLDAGGPVSAGRRGLVRGPLHPHAALALSARPSSPSLGARLRPRALRLSVFPVLTWCVGTRDGHPSGRVSGERPYMRESRVFISWLSLGSLGKGLDRTAGLVLASLGWASARRGSSGRVPARRAWDLARRARLWLAGQGLRTKPHRHSWTTIGLGPMSPKTIRASFALKWGWQFLFGGGGG